MNITLPFRAAGRPTFRDIFRLLSGEPDGHRGGRDSRGFPRERGVAHRLYVRAPWRHLPRYLPERTLPQGMANPSSRYPSPRYGKQTSQLSTPTYPSPRYGKQTIL